MDNPILLDIYTVGDGVTDKRRLHQFSSIFRPTTMALLDRVGIPLGTSCLEVGCGIGDVTFELARRVGALGRVVGMDIDAARIADARKEAAEDGLHNVEFRLADIRTYREKAENDKSTPEFGVIYSRFVLDHFSDPGKVIGTMRDMLVPGGVLIAECVDYSAWYCVPSLPAFDRVLKLHEELRLHTGGYTDMGARLPVLFLEADLSGIEISIFQYMQLAGPFKQWVLSTLTKERAEWMIALDLTTREEIDQLIAELAAHSENPRTAMGTPRFMQVWGYKGHEPDSYRLAR